jgi:hypothetical protein
VTDAAVVAFHGRGKPSVLGDLVRHLQNNLALDLGGAFVPRDLDTVHSTVVGLDSAAPASRRSLPALLADAGTDLAGLAAALVPALDARPLRLQYGGFEPDRPGLRSRGLPLHERSLTRSGSHVVLVGWPVDGHGEPTLDLHDLRCTASHHGFAHRYPLTDQEPDPDSHLVIGTLGDAVDEGVVAAALAAGREHLRRHPVHVDLHPRDLAVVLYAQPDLPLDSTTAVPLGEVASGRPDEAPTAP